MRSEIFGLLALESTNIVMKLEKELLENSIDVRIIPVPKEVTANCGLSIKFNLDDINSIKKYMEDKKINGELFQITKVGLKKEVEKI